MAEYAKNIVLAVGDLKPDVVGHVFEREGNALHNLTGFATPKFYLYDLDLGTYKLNGVTTGVSISDAANGEVTYVWQTGDTLIAGRYAAWFTYEPSASKPESAVGVEIDIKDPWEMFE